MLHRILFFLGAISALGYVGCSSQGAGGLATTSALLVALPLLPAAEAYHAISGDIDKDKQRGVELASQLRPVYFERTKLTERRKPVEDAEKLISRGIIFIMPMDFPRKNSFNMYPGMPSGWIKDIPPLYAEETIEVIAKDHLALYLMTITSDDPRHDTSVIYAFSQDKVYRKFWQSRHLYKERFNKTMATKLKDANNSRLDNRP
jgi:hypothetical protein